MILSAHLHTNIEFRHILYKLHGAKAGIYQTSALLPVFVGNGGQDFQLLIGVSPDCTENSCNLHALLSAGIRYRHRLHVLNDISRTEQVDMLYFLKKQLPCRCRCISNGNRLRTPHRRNQFILQNLGIILDQFLFHTLSLFSCSYF